MTENNLQQEQESFIKTVDGVQFIEICGETLNLSAIVEAIKEAEKNPPPALPEGLTDPGLLLAAKKRAEELGLTWEAQELDRQFKETIDAVIANLLKGLGDDERNKGDCSLEAA